MEIDYARAEKKMKAAFNKNKKILDAFIEEFRAYYHKLLRYKENPCDIMAEVLKKEFTRLFWRKSRMCRAGRYYS